MVFEAMSDDGRKFNYRDPKRYGYCLALITPCLIVLSYYLYFATGAAPAVLLIPFLYLFLLVPAVDYLIGAHAHNPPVSTESAMSEDTYYRYIIYLHIVINYAVFGLTVWFVGTQDLPLWAMLVLVITIGLSSGGTITLTHELGHKTSKMDQFMAKFGNALVGYGHFCIEHNRGHHLAVATPSDPASARLGETIYRFACREIPGALLGGVHQEKRRLSKRGHGFWHYKNDILQGYALTLAIALVCAAVFGPAILAFILAHHAYGWYALTQANYIEHYGLARQKLPNGKYERTQPRHSWNSDHSFSNLQLYHLQRHSDHHAHPRRPYQILRTYDDVPTLPNGYLGCFLLAAVPPLWFAVIDPLVLDWAGGDLAKTNIEPSAKARLYKKYAKVEG